MLDKIKNILLLGSFLIVGILNGQNNVVTPFSNFGMGMVHDDNTVFYKGLGDLGASYLDYYHLNLKNPATLAFLRATAFEAGISAKYSALSDENNKDNIWSGSLDYLALGFPLKNPINASLEKERKDYSFGMSLYLKPNTSIGYNISTVNTHPELGNYVNSFEGTGGTYKLMWGNSMKYKNFSVGFSGGYLFGNVLYRERLYFTDQLVTFSNRYDLNYNVNGFIWDAGVFYNWLINKEAIKKNKNLEAKVLSIGAYGNSAQKFYSKGSLIEQSVFGAINNPLEEFSDSLGTGNRVNGTGKLPAEFGLGATFVNGSKFSLGVNYEYSLWSGYENSFRSETLSDSYKLSLGGSYRPDVKSYNNYFKRVLYKAGVFYQQNPQIIENQKINEFGLNLGATFPFYYQRKISHLNAAFQFGMKGNGTPIQELYGRINLGFTFNDDEWFIQRKYN